MGNIVNLQLQLTHCSVNFNVHNTFKFVLNVFYLFAAGQTMSKKISKNINRVHRKLKKTMKLYEDCPSADKLHWDFVVDLDSQFWKDLHFVNSANTLVHQAAEFVYLYLRSKEEVSLLTTEMDRYLTFLMDEHSTITNNWLNLLQDTSLVSKGVSAQLCCKAYWLEMHIEFCANLFAGCTELPIVPTYFRAIVEEETSIESNYDVEESESELSSSDSECE